MRGAMLPTVLSQPSEVKALHPVPRYTRMRRRWCAQRETYSRFRSHVPAASNQERRTGTAAGSSSGAAAQGGGPVTCVKMTWDEGRRQPASRASPGESVTERTRLASTLLPLCSPTAVATASGTQVA